MAAIASETGDQTISRALLACNGGVTNVDRRSKEALQAAPSRSTLVQDDVVVPALRRAGVLVDMGLVG
jgi:hypothetical protein